jgi:hypothetical protein
MPKIKYSKQVNYTKWLERKQAKEQAKRNCKKIKKY